MKFKIPQKRYLVLGAIIIYYAAKVYVDYTPSTEDDQYPDQVREFVVQYFADEGAKPDPSSNYDEAGLQYGEGYA